MGATLEDQPLAVDNHGIAVGQNLEKRRARGVDQPHARPDKRQRPGVGIASVGGGRDVDHRLHPGGGELLGRDPVEVEVIDDGNVGGPQALDEVLRLAPQPGAAVNR
jgi:hypothetical protein